jgi:hypothetical protein
MKKVLIALIMMLMFASYGMAKNFNTIALPKKKKMKVVDFFGSDSTSLAVLTSINEKTLLGLKSSYYVYVNKQYDGPYNKVLDVIVSPSGKKHAVLFTKADDRAIYLRYNGKDHVIGRTNSRKKYSRYKPKKMGFIGDEEKFFMPSYKRTYRRPIYIQKAYLENKIIPGINIESSKKIKIADDNSHVMIVNNYLHSSNNHLTCLYGDGTRKDFYAKEDKEYQPEEVTEVSGGGTAESAGVLPGDRLLSVNGYKVLDNQGFNNFIRAENSESNILTVEREGKSVKLTIYEISKRFGVKVIKSQ